MPTLSLNHSVAFHLTVHTLIIAVLLCGCAAGAVKWKRVRRRDMLQTYMALADASPQIVYLTDAGGNCIAVNQRWCEVTGQSQAAALGQGFREVMHPRDRDEEAFAWERARHGERSHEHQIRFCLADGSSRWHLLRSIPVRDDCGIILAWMGTASNVDAQVRAADSMRFLADASEAISNSLDVDDNVSTLTRVAAASFADFAAVWMRMPDENSRLVSLAHVYPIKQAELERSIDPTALPSDMVRQVLDGQGPLLVTDVMTLDPLSRERFAQLDAQSVIVVPLDTRDQTLGALMLARGSGRNRFDEQDVGLAAALAKRAGSAIVNARLFEASCAVAKTLQSAFFPPFLPVMEGLAFEAVYRPAAHDAQVGGDWYDVFPLHDGRLALSIGDIMGHGIAAATAMVRMRETIRAAAGSLDADPSAVLAFANRAMCSSEGHGLATAVFAVYDARSSRLDYAVCRSSEAAACARQALYRIRS